MDDLISAAASLKRQPRLPVAPSIITFAATCAQMTQAQIFASFESWERALEITFERIGMPDAVFPLWPRDAALSQPLRALLPGRDLPEDAQFQLTEAQVMTREDYTVILTLGYRRWFLDFLERIRLDLPASLKRFRIVRGFISQGLGIRAHAEHWNRRGIPLLFSSACYPPFDLFSLARSLVPFCQDLKECREMIAKAGDVAVPGIISNTLIPLRVTGGKRVCIFPMRSSASFISPHMFETLALPSLVRMVERFWSQGILSILHCDGNWTPTLPYLRELPRASCIIELDGMTDIHKAREILDGWLCIKGDVPATLLAFGEPEEVYEYASRLVRDIGSDGGFILSSGCEVPLNAQIENVTALMKAGRCFQFS